MTDRAQLDYALIDVDLLTKPKVVALMARFSPLIGLYYIQLILMLSKATNAEVDVYAAYGAGLAFGVDIETAKLVVAYCVEKEMLQLEGDVLSQRRVIEDQERLARKRKKNRNGQEAFRNRLQESGDNRLEIDDPDTVTVTEDINKKENSQPLPKAPKPPPGFREGCERYGEFLHIWLKKEEYDKLKAQFGDALRPKIISLDAQIENKNKQYLAYKNHYATLKNWLSSDKSKVFVGTGQAVQQVRTMAQPKEFIPREKPPPLTPEQIAQKNELMEKAGFRRGGAV